ncbi:MAG: hypothetical protein CMJ58_05465 [Planctomycetaceae bacterium]|nr:hypothetical protein [Planctomycetaceae bacterium]
MALGKTLRLYLSDGSPTGPIVAEIINWTGQVIVVPRSQLHEMAKREELQRTGVYMLVGPDAQGDGDRVYVGEADDVFERLKAHDKDDTKDFWTRAVTITSKDFNLTKSHGRYLESRLIDLSQIAGRAIVANNTSPGLKTLPESDVADMEYFLDQIRLMLPVLGFDFLRPPATQDQPTQAAQVPALTMSEVGVTAHAKEIDGAFVVLKGSTARQNGAPSWDSYVSLRDELVAQGRLMPKDAESLEFADDVEFSSPSAAAAVVAAGNRNGRITWKLNDGRTYAEWKESLVEEAEG